MSFNQGLQGVATGSAMNSVGLIYHSMYKDSDKKEEPPQAAVSLCRVNEVRWHSDGDCFTPTQKHINIAVSSIAINIVLIVVIIYQRFRIKSQKEQHHV